MDLSSEEVEAGLAETEEAQVSRLSYPYPLSDDEVERQEAEDSDVSNESGEKTDRERSGGTRAPEPSATSQRRPERQIRLALERLSGREN